MVALESPREIPGDGTGLKLQPQIADRLPGRHMCQCLRLAAAVGAEGPEP